MPLMMRSVPTQGSKLVDGYAPFCKHIFVRNFVGARLGAMQITDANRHLLQCGYSRRRPEELPVLTRWLASPPARSSLLLTGCASNKIAAKLKGCAVNCTHELQLLAALLPLPLSRYLPFAGVHACQESLGKCAARISLGILCTCA